MWEKSQNCGGGGCLLWTIIIIIIIIIIYPMAETSFHVKR